MALISKCGLMLEPQFGMTVRQLVETAKEAESLGFGYLFRSDHLLPTDDSRGKDSPECWTSLGAVAADTTTIKFGPMVTPLGFRNPALLARMACTLHSFSGGRLQLAVGAGWYEPEYRAHGYEFPSFAVRRMQFEEGLSILLSMVRDGRVDFEFKTAVKAIYVPDNVELRGIRPGMRAAHVKSPHARQPDSEEAGDVDAA